jgi:archaellum biogenesis ATPase FlaH
MNLQHEWLDLMKTIRDYPCSDFQKGVALGYAKQVTTILMDISPHMIAGTMQMLRDNVNRALTARQRRSLNRLIELHERCMLGLEI